jgi:hypothetical protein
MRRKALLVLGAGLMLLQMAVPAAAVNFNGKITLVQSSTAAGTRFYVQPRNLSLYATGDLQAILLQAFFRKAAVDVTYTIMPCKGGINGTCANVTMVTVDAANFQ